MTQETVQTAADVVVNADPNVYTKEMSFRFKKDKMGNQRQTVKLNLPVPSAEGIKAILREGGKDLELLLEVCADTVRSVAVGIVGDKEDISQENFPFDQVGWHAIATAPRAERAKIADEVWEAFAKDYIEIMPGLTNKTLDNVTNATQVYLKKFAQVKTNKPILKKLQEQLTIYVDNSKKVEDFSEILELLIGKLDTYLKANDVEQLIANL
jgi:hypothetical protein